MDETVTPSTTAHAPGRSTLHVLPKEDVLRICSGQSVVDLATAVKELVENALDAGATQIEVKLKEYGKESIEVSDNGSGVTPDNYETLALKHYTSKISTFEDIASVASFGFRGEALSSLCQLAAHFSVCTRTQSDPIGTTLVFNTSGTLVSQIKKARPVGTTVLVEELFKPLPVRAKDFHRNIKKHYAKLLRVLQGYAVSCVNVKLSVSNTTGKHASRQIVLSTQAHQSMGENIASVFGTKFFRTLTGVDFDLNTAWPSEDVSSQAEPEEESKHDDQDEINKASRRVVGFVSRVGEGVGRSDNDRQFFFINSRPFDLPRVAKAVNDVWRQFEMKQKPACVLNFLLPPHEFDVNVTPDKRETFLKHELHLIESLKTQLTRHYEPSRGTFLVQPLLTTLTTSQPKKEEEPPAKKPEEEEHGAMTSLLTDEVEAVAQNARYLTVEEPPSTTPKATDEEQKEEMSDETTTTAIEEKEPEPTPAQRPSYSSLQARVSAMNEISEGRATKKQRAASEDEADEEPRVIRSVPHAAPSAPQVPQMMQEWSLDELRQQRQTYFQSEVELEQKRKQRRTRLKVPKSGHADALEPDNSLAAAALQRVLQKDDFRRMDIVGQFNLGFIIANLDDDDLFIIDQHASDEKFNYETLQRTTVLHQQPLVRPLHLELTAAEEMIILDNLDVFTRHGFTFAVQKEAPPTKKLQLVSLPFSKQTQFGVDDIRELASLLMETPLQRSAIQLPKRMAMLASRACRSSIMIGTALHKEEMTRIVRNLTTLEQPWNCPHGRPTLRHLADLAQLQEQEADR
ncbi:hypothetical protein Poli38472_010600 [Pythium oligandrum]|uniref:Uncharacterized protein n=1 Tax=Pythium oligandrum TaxID=41045 RepID=A0A8K1C3K6_PYTOL|nr:hypothetical protein Poli38472_010600 [Pythium oligandrum]|eukprot:TMW55718.1 hypothetical protein Poli38472_010600 [Pythium oligandrum]